MICNETTAYITHYSIAGSKMVSNLLSYPGVMRLFSAPGAKTEVPQHTCLHGTHIYVGHTHFVMGTTQMCGGNKSCRTSWPLAPGARNNFWVYGMCLEVNFMPSSTLSCLAKHIIIIFLMLLVIIFLP